MVHGLKEALMVLGLEPELAHNRNTTIQSELDGEMYRKEVYRFSDIALGWTWD